MSNKLWVKYKSSDGSSAEKYYYDQVIGLANDALVDDLRRAFVLQKHMQINEDAVEVRKEENGEMLKASNSLFVVDSAATATPAWGGQSEDTALFVVAPKKQQQQVSFVVLAAIDYASCVRTCLKFFLNCY
jgi:hypothetical protein